MTPDENIYPCTDTAVADLTGVSSRCVKEVREALLTTRDPRLTVINQSREQGWKLMGCSHGQELCQQASLLLIGYIRVNNQSEARSAS